MKEFDKAEKMEKRDIRACIFDLDGTLLDTLTSLWYCANKSLEQEGLKPLPKDSFRYYVGDGALTQVERYLKDTDIAETVGAMPDTEDSMDDCPSGTDTCVDDCPSGSGTGSSFSGTMERKLPPDPHDPANLGYYFQSYMSFLNRFADYEVKPYDGIPELLKELKKKGLKLAVFSNKPHQAAVKVIDEYFGDIFDIVLGKKEENPKKPDPAGALKIAGEFGVKPENIIYIGDTDTDMQTGKNAGMFTVGVLWGFRDMAELKANHADAIAASPADILELIG